MPSRNQATRLIITAVMAAFFPVCVTAAEVEHVDIYEYGLYDTVTTKIVTDPNVPGGERRLVKNLVLIEQTDKIPMMISDVVFGFRYRVKGTPEKAEILLGRKLIYPEPGKWDPDNQKYIKDYLYGLNTKIGDDGFTAVKLTEKIDLIPGPWKFQLWYNGKLMAEKIFTLVENE